MNQESLDKILAEHGIEPGEMTYSLTKSIMALIVDSRVRELESLLDEHQQNSQDMERANPGFSFEVVPADVMYDRIKELKERGRA